MTMGVALGSRYAVTHYKRCCWVLCVQLRRLCAGGLGTARHSCTGLPLSQRADLQQATVVCLAHDHTGEPRLAKVAAAHAVTQGQIRDAPPLLKHAAQRHEQIEVQNA